jgi:hypothetical protein
MATAQAPSVKARAHRRTGSAHRLRRQQLRAAEARTEATGVGTSKAFSAASAQQTSSRNHTTRDSTTPPRAEHVARTIGHSYLSAVPRMFRHKQRHHRKRILLHTGGNREKLRLSCDIRLTLHLHPAIRKSYAPHCRSNGGGVDAPALEDTRERRGVG